MSVPDAFCYIGIVLKLWRQYTVGKKRHYLSKEN
jgi:hypothetical protein